MKKWVILAGVVALFGFGLIAKVRLGQQSDGSFLVSSGQRIELLGQVTRLEGVRPKDMALSPDKQQVALLTHGRLIVSELSGKSLGEIKMSAGPLGVAWAPDGKTIYASLGSGKLGCFNWTGTTLSKSQEVVVEPAGRRGNPGTGGLAVTTNGDIYAALSIRNEVVALSSEGHIKSIWKVGACPYHLALSPDGHTLAVANRGGTVVGASPEQEDPDTRKPFEGTTVANAESAGTKVQIDPRTDVALVGTVSLIAIDSPNAEPNSVTVGRQPSGMAFSSDNHTLYIADSDEDAVSVVDTAKKTELAKIPIAPKEDPTFGQIPTAVALSADEKRLFVEIGCAYCLDLVFIGV